MIRSENQPVGMNEIDGVLLIPPAFERVAPIRTGGRHMRQCAGILKDGETIPDRLRHAVAVCLTESVNRVECLGEPSTTKSDFHTRVWFSYLSGNILFVPGRGKQAESRRKSRMIPRNQIRGAWSSRRPNHAQILCGTVLHQSVGASLVDSQSGDNRANPNNGQPEGLPLRCGDREAAKLSTRLFNSRSCRGLAALGAERELLDSLGSNHPTTRFHSLIGFNGYCRTPLDVSAPLG